MEIQKNFSLKKYNTFNFDVKAKYFVQVSALTEIKKVVKNIEYKNFPKLVIGRGSNILFKNDYNGLVFNFTNDYIDVIDEDSNYVYIKVGAGVIWDKFVEFTVANNYWGVENLSLIPGTVGASPIQNIGAYGKEVKDSIVSVYGINIVTGKEKSFSLEECNFGYRNSIFKNLLKNIFFIFEVTFKLSKNQIPSITYGSIKAELEKLSQKEYSLSDIRKAIITIRKAKLPDPEKIGNAGSFFKNPEIGESRFLSLKKRFPQMPYYTSIDGKYKIPAGWLIEQCGWKGKRIGDAGTYSEQALILCNFGNAKPNQLIELSNTIKNSVQEKFGISIMEEVNIF